MDSPLPPPPPESRRLVATLATTGLVSFLIVFLLCASLLRGEAESRRSTAARDGAVYAQRITHRLQEWMGATYMLGTLVQRDSGKVIDFETHASRIHEMFPAISALQLAPNGVIKHIYPLPGNEIVLGTDLLTSKDRRFEAHQAMSKGQLVISGPYSLAQGGIGTIGRYPITLQTTDGWGKFWGFAIVVVRIPQLLDAARIGDLAEEGYRFELCRIVDEENCEHFARRGEGPPIDPVVVKISLPNNEWRLHLAPEDGWYPLRYWIASLAGSLAVALAAVCLQYLLLRRLAR